MLQINRGGDFDMTAHAFDGPRDVLFLEFGRVLVIHDFEIVASAFLRLGQ